MHLMVENKKVFQLLVHYTLLADGPRLIKCTATPAVIQPDLSKLPYAFTSVLIDDI